MPTREILSEPFTGPTAWKTVDYRENEKWVRYFTEIELREINAATTNLKARGIEPETFTRDDFPLPTFSTVLNDIHDELENGRGFILLRGLNVEDYDLETLKILYWGLGTHLGEIISQNAYGDLLGYVTDFEGFAKGGYYDKGVRGHRTSAHLLPHCDSSDTVGLLCVHPAKEGGRSMICSSMAIYNEILEKHPEYLECLYEGFYFDLVGKGKTKDEISEHKIPVFSYYQGWLSCRFNKRQIELGMEKAGTPLNDLQQAAVDYVRELSIRDDFLLQMDFQPGDIQLLNNHCTLHSRGEFTDWPDETRKRLLLRLWLNVPNGRPLAPEFANRLNTGSRQGVTKRLKIDKHARPAHT
jgi:hypothetical protein